MASGHQTDEHQEATQEAAEDGVVQRNVSNTSKSSKSSLSVRQIPAIVLANIRSNMVPALVMFTVGTAVVIAYYTSDDVRLQLGKVEDVKQVLGWGFPVITTSITAGLLPSLFLWASGKLPAPAPIQVIFFVVFWAQQGLLQELFYQLQSLIFSDDVKPGIIIAKVAVDQFLWNPFFMTPYIFLWMRWRENNFDFKATVMDIMTDVGHILLGIASQLFAVWVTWIPACALIYSMPGPLQLPLFNVVMFFFSMFVALLQRHVKTSLVVSAAAPPPSPASKTSTVSLAREISRQASLEQLPS